MLREQPSLGSVGPSRAPPWSGVSGGEPGGPAARGCPTRSAPAEGRPPCPCCRTPPPPPARSSPLPAPWSRSARPSVRCPSRRRRRRPRRSAPPARGTTGTVAPRTVSTPARCGHARGAARRHGGPGLLRAGRVLRQHRQAGQHQPRRPAQGHLPRHDVRHLPRVRLRRDVDHRALRRPGGRLVHQRPHRRGQGPGRRGGQLAHGDRRPGQCGRQRPPPRRHVHHLEQPHLGRLPPCRRLAALRRVRRHALARQ